VQSCQERPMNVHAHSIHVFFMQCCQERPMNVNIHSFSLALTCIWCHIDTQSLPTWCSMNIAYPGIRSLPTPYGLTLHTFSHSQAKVLAICLWLPSLLLEYNAIPSSPSWHLVGPCVPPSSSQCLTWSSMLPSSLWHPIQFLQCLSFKHNAMLPGSMQHLIQFFMPSSPLQHLICFSKCCFWSLEHCFMFWRWWLLSPRGWSQILLRLRMPRLPSMASLQHPVCLLPHFPAWTISLLVTHMPVIFLQAQPAASQRNLCESVDLDDLLWVQLATWQCIHKLVNLVDLDISNGDVYNLCIRPMMPCPSGAICYGLCVMPMMPCLTVLAWSLLTTNMIPCPRRETTSHSLWRPSIMMASQVASYLSPKPLPSATHLENQLPWIPRPCMYFPYLLILADTCMLIPLANNPLLSTVTVA